MIKHRSPAGFEWSSPVISKDSNVKVHSDSHNLRGSANLLLSVGNHKGGELWIEDSQVDDSKAVFQTGANGVSLKGKVLCTYDEPTLFDPTKKHCVLPHQGTRISITAYTSRGFPKLTQAETDKLRTYGFRCNQSAAAAAPDARLTSRPGDIARVMVDFGTDPCTTSLEPHNGCYLLCVPNHPTSLHNKALNKIANNLHSLCDEGGGNKPKPLLFFASFVSSPSELDWNKVLKSLTSLCRLVKKLEPQIVLETQNNFSWDTPSVVCLMRDYGLLRCDHGLYSYASSVALKLRERPEVAKTEPLMAKVFES